MWDDGGDFSSAVPFPLAGILAAPAIRNAIQALARDPASGRSDRDLREALGHGAVAETPLARALRLDDRFRAAFTAAVRDGIDSSATREFLVRYLSATGRTAELDRLNSQSHLPDHQSDLYDLFDENELRALGELHVSYTSAASFTSS